MLAPLALPPCIAAVTALQWSLHCSGYSLSFSLLPACSKLQHTCVPAGHCHKIAVTPSGGDCLLQLRSGFIFENQFLSGLSMAGLDKHLRPQHLQA